MTDKLKVDGKQNGKKLFDITPVEVELRSVKWGDRAKMLNISQKITREAATGDVDWNDIGYLLELATTLKEDDFEKFTDPQILAICMKIIESRSANVKKKLKK